VEPRKEEEEEEDSNEFYRNRFLIFVLELNG
jgi:hypothetical protein